MKERRRNRHNKVQREHRQDGSEREKRRKERVAPSCHREASRGKTRALSSRASAAASSTVEFEGDEHGGDVRW